MANKQYFTGTYLHTLDERGRIAIPARLREKLGEMVSVVRGRGNCLVVYPHEAWITMAEQVLAKPGRNPILNPVEEDEAMRMFSEVWDGEMDKQGRIPIPDYLRQDAKLISDVAVVGLGDHIQIWDKEAWLARRADLRRSPPVAQVTRPAERTAEA